MDNYNYDAEEKKFFGSSLLPAFSQKLATKTITLSSVGSEKTFFLNDDITHVLVEAFSRVVLVKNLLSDNLTKLTITILEKAHCTLLIMTSLKGETYFLRSQIEIVLAGEGSHITLCTVHALNQKQKLSQIITILHKAPQTKSRLYAYGALFEAAEAMIKATVTIDKNSYQSDAEQTLKQLLLSTQSRGFNLPILDVNNNQVKCKHGSACGTLNDQDLWFLESRGLSKEQKKSLLVTAFFEEAVTKSLTCEKQYLADSFGSFLRSILSERTT